MLKASDLNEPNSNIEKWKRVIFSDFHASITNKVSPFPWIFGVNGYKKDMFRFSFYEEITADVI